MTVADTDNRGRSKVSGEDRAKAHTIMLHKFHEELLTYIPGKNDSEKMRYLLEIHPRYIERTKKHINSLEETVNKLFSIAEKWHDPSYQDRKKEIAKAFNTAFEGFLSIEGIMGLSEEEYRKFGSDEFLNKRRSIFLKYDFIQDFLRGSGPKSLHKVYEKGAKNEFN